MSSTFFMPANGIDMIILQQFFVSVFKRSGLSISLGLLLTACASHVPLTETRPPLPFLQPSMALVTGDFICDQGKQVIVNGSDDAHMELRWHGRSYPMTKVPTSTGAWRFENPGEGLVWIQIPAKSMLLDSRIEQQLANNCKNR
jgi:hypothetical protein